MFNLPQWVMWLRGLHALVGLPMVILGLAFMLGGWRMGRVLVVLTLAALGGWTGLAFAAYHSQSLVLGAGGAVLLGVLGVVLKQHAPSVLGGLIGTGMLMQFLGPLGLPEWASAVAVGLMFVCVAAWCLPYQQTVVIVITAFEGAALLVSGLVPILACWPYLFRFLESTNHASWVFFPFMILVPTAVGSFLQIADSRRHLDGAARV